MMITPSTELAAIVRRWGVAVEARDELTLRNLLSTSEHLSYLGSAEDELWTGKVLRDGIGDHFREVPKFEQGKGDIHAFECGDVGWGYSFKPLRFEGFDAFVMHRTTFVFVLEHGAWKIAHIHLSNPTANIEKMGVESNALDALMTAARDGFAGLGREGMASVMFTDVVDSSALADLVGDRIWMHRIDKHLEQVRLIIEKQGGTLVKSLGDGTMSTFASARAALSAAQAIQRAAIADTSEPVLRVRIGLHTGEVIENKGDFFGTVVNKAARINALAAPDEIRLSDATRIMLGRADDLVFEDPQEVPLKGLDGTHLVHRLTY